MPTPTSPPLIGDNQKLSIRYFPTDQFTRNDDGPRVFSRAQIKRAKRIIKRFGFRIPLVADENLRVLVGDLLLLAAMELGYLELPVVFASGLSQPELDALSVAYGRLWETGDWDKAKLGELFLRLEIELPDLDLLDLGFEVPEIDLSIEAHQGSDEPNEDIEDGPAVSRRGDLFLLGKHRLIVGDATSIADITKLMNQRRANAMFTDPPYNVEIDGFVSGNGARHHREFPMASGEMTPAEFTSFNSTWIELACRFSHGGAVHFICMDWRHMRELLDAGVGLYGALLNLCVWIKDRPGMGSHWRSQHELVFAWRVGREQQLNTVQLGKFGRNRTNVWSYPAAATFLKKDEQGEMVKGHPTPKPVNLVADALLDCTKRGDIVLDPFLGSGTTIMAAERTGRICHACELDPLYADLSIRRWEASTGEVAIHEETGLTFHDLMQVRLREGDHG